MLKQRLQQKLLQKLSPQQIQMIKLLEIPTIQLEQRIKSEIEENPVLEIGKEDNGDDMEDTDTSPEDQEEFSIDDYLNEDDIPSYKLATRNYSKDEKREDIPFSIGTSFKDHLEAQLGLRVLSEKQEVLADYILGNIDEDGYLRRELINIANDLAFSHNIETTEEELLEILKIIQDCEPNGVGARDLQECLFIQLEKKEIETDSVILAKKIMSQYFSEFTKKHYDKILNRTGATEQELKDAIDEILKLNPKPGGSYHDPHNKTAQQIIPDFLLENRDGELILSLNAKNVPELRISRTYSTMLDTYSHKPKNKKTKGDKEAISFVKHKIDSARWFIDAIRQRQETLTLTMEAILEYQYDFFLEGEETALKPMILKDIADKTGLDISTISRVANSKYIQTHFGIYSLKFFFSESMQTDSGEEVSTREIKKILQDCVDAEDKRSPLTDDKLAAILKEKGYHIARRTIAKYREQLNIPVARLRKEL